METKQNYTNWFAVAFATTFIGICFATVYFKVPSIMPMLMEEYSIDLNQASLLMSVFTIVPLVLAIPSGILVKRIGPTNLYIFATIFVVIGSIIGAFADGANLLIFSRGLEGVALIFGMIAGPIAIQTFVAPENRGKALGFFGVNISVGSFLGGVITPSLADKVDIFGVWLSYAGLCVIALLLLIICLKKKNYSKETLESNDVSQQENEAKVTLLFKPYIFRFLIGFMLWNLGVLAVLTFAPTFMQGEGITPTMSGTMSTLPSLLSIIICPIFGILADKTNNNKALLVISAASIVPGCFIIFTTTNWPIWIGIIFLGFGMAVPTMSFIIFPKLLPRPELLGIGMGILNLASNLGMLLGTILPAAVLEITNGSWFTVGATLFGLTIIGVLCYISVTTKKQDFVLHEGAVK